MEDKKIEELKSEYGCDNKQYTRHQLERLLALGMTLYKFYKLDKFPVLGIENKEGKFHLFKKSDNSWEAYLCVDGVATKRTPNNYSQYYTIESMLESIFDINNQEIFSIELHDRKYLDYFYRFCNIDVTDEELEKFKEVVIDKTGSEKDEYGLLDLITELIIKYDDERVCRYYRPLLNYDINAGRREDTNYTRHELEGLYSLKLAVLKYKEELDDLGPFMNADTLSGGTYIIKNPLGCFEVFDVDDERKYVLEPRYVFENFERACLEVINHILKKRDKIDEATKFFYKVFNSNITDEELENFRFFFLSGCMKRRSDKNRKEEKERRREEYNLSLKKRGVNR